MLRTCCAKAVLGLLAVLLCSLSIACEREPTASAAATTMTAGLPLDVGTPEEPDASDTAVRPTATPDASSAPDVGTPDAGTDARALDVGAQPAAVEEPAAAKPASDRECETDSDCSHKKLKCPCRVWCEKSSGTCRVERLEPRKSDVKLPFENL